MRRWRATLDRGKMGEITESKRKADACKKHSQRLKKYLQERMPSQVVEAIWNVTAAQLSPDPVRSAVLECICTGRVVDAISTLLHARLQRRSALAVVGVMTISRLLSTSTSQHATGAGGAAPSRGQSKRTGSCSMPSGSRWSTLQYRSAQIGSHRLGPRRACHRASDVRLDETGGEEQ